MADRCELLKKIDAVSFFLNDLTLYLDTHPSDDSGLSAYFKMSGVRKQLLQKYADEFEPLTMDCICPNPQQSSGKNCFSWTSGPVVWDNEQSKGGAF
ncbi:MAG: spore coat protein CotJB [Lachnospiraceae bacterium]